MLSFWIMREWLVVVSFGIQWLWFGQPILWLLLSLLIVSIWVMEYYVCMALVIDELWQPLVMNDVSHWQSIANSNLGSAGHIYTIHGGNGVSHYWALSIVVAIKFAIIIIVQLSISGFWSGQPNPLMSSLQCHCGYGENGVYQWWFWSGEPNPLLSGLPYFPSMKGAKKLQGGFVMSLAFILGRMKSDTYSAHFLLVALCCKCGIYRGAI